MNNPSTIQQLRDMKFSGMANELELQLRDPAAYAQVSFDDRLGLLVNAEWNRKQANKLKRRIRDARLDIPSATPEGIEYYEDRKLDKAQMLRFSTCKFMVSCNIHYSDTILVIKAWSGDEIAQLIKH